MLRDIPKGLANTVRSIYEKSVKEHIEAKQDEIQRINALREAAKAHTVPKTEKEKKLAALADDGKKDVITHADVMAGRGVKKEAWEDMIKAVKDAAKPQPNGGAGIKKGRAYGGANQKDTKPMKEEVEQLAEGVHVMDHEGDTHVHVPDAKSVGELDKAIEHHLVKAHGYSKEDAHTHYSNYKADSYFHHDKPEKGSKPDEVRTKAEHAKEIGDNIHNMLKDADQHEAMSHQAKTTMKHIPNPSPALKRAAKDIKPGVAGYRDRIAMLKAGNVKEEVEQIDELNKDTLHSYQAKADKQIVAKHRVLGPQIKAGDAKAANKTSAIIGKRMAGIDRAVERLNKEETEQVEEAMDTPGNSTHQCAVHVKSEQFGEGKALFSQHAEPAEDGSIEWYDIMFEHGIEKKVPTASLEILVSESHMNHKKKKAA